MKKSLFAVAALSAIAGAAQAQSSVTVYGIIDAGYIGANTTTTTTSTLVLNGQAKAQSNQLGAGAESSSRLGFKGTEDLGGGTSAFFTIEMGVNPQVGNLSGTAAANPKYDLQQTTDASGSAIDNRQTFVGLKKSGLGQFAFGRQYTTVFNAVAATSPGQMNNMMGDAIYSGSSSGASVNTYLNTMTNRADNQLSFATDKFAGFGLQGFYALNGANSTNLVTTPTVAAPNSQGGNVNWGGWGLGADYTWNKLFVTAAMQQFRTKYDNNVNQANGTVLNLGGAGPTSGQPLAAALIYGPTNNTDQQVYFAGTYDFGILKAYAQYINRTVSQNNWGGGTIGTSAASAQVPGNTLKRSAEQIGVRSYVTPSIEAWASAGLVKYTGAITSGALVLAPSLPVANGNMYQLGSNYYLSKRTNLYAIYGSYNASSNTPSNGIAGAGSNYALGLRHTF